MTIETDEPCEDCDATDLLCAHLFWRRPEKLSTLLDEKRRAKIMRWKRSRPDLPAWLAEQLIRVYADAEGKQCRRKR